MLFLHGIYLTCSVKRIEVFVYFIAFYHIKSKPTHSCIAMKHTIRPMWWLMLICGIAGRNMFTGTVWYSVKLGPQWWWIRFFPPPLQIVSCSTLLWLQWLVGGDAVWLGQNSMVSVTWSCFKPEPSEISLAPSPPHLGWAGTGGKAWWEMVQRSR